MTALLVRGPTALLAVANGTRGATAALANLIVTLGIASQVVVVSYNTWSICFSFASFILFLEAGTPVLTTSLRSRDTKQPALYASFVAVRAVLPIWGLAAFLVAGFGLSLHTLYPATIGGGTTLALVLCLAAANLTFMVSNILWAEILGRPEDVLVRVWIGSVCLRLAAPVAAVIAASRAGIAASAIILLVGQIFVVIFTIEQHKRVGSPVQDVPRRNVRSDVASMRKRVVVMFGLSVAMICVTGLDGPLVGRFDYRNVGSYAAVVVVVTGVAGIANSLSAPLVRRFATGGGGQRAEAVLHSVVQINAKLVFATLAATLTLGPCVLNATLAHSQYVSAVRVLPILATGICVRQLAVPALMHAVSGDQVSRAILRPASIEALTNVTVSLGLGLVLGMYGVAAGTAIGSVVGLYVSIPVLLRGLSPDATSRGYLKQCLGTVPILCLTVAALAALGWCWAVAQA